MHGNLVKMAVVVAIFSNVIFAQILIAQGGDAVVTRTKTLQGVHEGSGNADVTRIRNLDAVRLVRGNTDIIRYRNMALISLGVIYNLFANVSIASTDQDGNPQTTFLRGQIVEFAITAFNNGTLPLTNAVLSLLVLDPNSALVFLSYSLETLRPGIGKSEFFGYMISTSAPAGLYTAKLSFFTNWPSAGGVGLDSAIANFQVV